FKETLAVFYEGGLLCQDSPDHKIQRRMLQTAFKTDSMKTYVERMSPIMAKHIASWGQGKEMEFFPAVKKTLLEVGSTVFVGLDDKALANKFNTAFIHINEGLLGIIRKELPFTAYGRGQKGKRFALDVLKNLIPERRPTEMRDMLTYMTQEKAEDGDYFSDDVICKQILFLLFAAHDTTTSTLNHLLYYTATHPEWQEKMREEVLAMGADSLSYDRLDELKSIDLVFDETLRLHPAVPMSMRRTIRECEIEGHRIPAHTILFMPAAFNQRDPKFWTEPDKFDPMRFTEGREEHKTHPYCYHPFGGGAHKCIGMHFARMLTKTFMFELLRNNRYTLPEDFQVKFDWVPLPRPKKLPLTLHKL
ncbi:MAG: cytochrome P450, partial [Pseudomonadota bacterium]